MLMKEVGRNIQSKEELVTNLMSMDRSDLEKQAIKMADISQGRLQ